MLPGLSWRRGSLGVRGAGCGRRRCRPRRTGDVVDGGACHAAAQVADGCRVSLEGTRALRFCRASPRSVHQAALVGVGPGLRGVLGTGAGRRAARLRADLGGSGQLSSPLGEVNGFHVGSVEPGRPSACHGMRSVERMSGVPGPDSLMVLDDQDSGGRGGRLGHCAAACRLQRSSTSSGPEMNSSGSVTFLPLWMGPDHRSSRASRVLGRPSRGTNLGVPQCLAGWAGQVKHRCCCALGSLPARGAASTHCDGVAAPMSQRFTIASEGRQP